MATLKAAAAADDQDDFDVEMATHSFWSGLSSGEQDCEWESARKHWG